MLFLGKQSMEEKLELLRYEAVSEWVTEKVLREDKNPSTGLTMSDPQITCVHICISLNTNDNTPILQTCLTSSWSCLRSTVANSVKLFLWEV